MIRGVQMIIEWFKMIRVVQNDMSFYTGEPTPQGEGG